MVEFAVFNELSLPFQNNIDIENKFIDFFKLLKELENKNLTKIRMDKNFKNYPEIIKNITFQQFFGQLHESVIKDRLREFITNGIIKIESPLIKIEENDEQNEILENEYFYKKESTIGGLACCHIWDTVAVSFQSNKEWNKEKIVLQKQTILDEQEINIDIRHASKVEHLNSHQKFFKELEEEKKLDITQNNFWERKKEFFPKRIVFCKEVEKQIKDLDKRILQQVVNILRNIETNKKLITDYKHSPESQSVKNDDSLRRQRLFTIENNKVFFENHIKSLPNANRIYFLEQGDRIFIGYIGKHLPTKKH